MSRAVYRGLHSSCILWRLDGCRALLRLLPLARECFPILVGSSLARRFMSSLLVIVCFYASWRSLAAFPSCGNAADDSFDARAVSARCRLPSPYRWATAGICSCLSCDLYRFTRNLKIGVCGNWCALAAGLSSQDLVYKTVCYKQVSL